MLGSTVSLSLAYTAGTILEKVRSDVGDDVFCIPMVVLTVLVGLSTAGMVVGSFKACGQMLTAESTHKACSIPRTVSLFTSNTIMSPYRNTG